MQFKESCVLSPKKKITKDLVRMINKSGGGEREKRFDKKTVLGIKIKLFKKQKKEKN